MTLAIGVDVGGTKIAAGVVDTGTGEVLARHRRSTPAHDGDAVAATIGELAGELGREHDVAAIGLGVPGFVDRDREHVLLAPNLALSTRPLRADVAARTGLPVVLENDANAAAWAEHRLGAAVGHDDALVVTAGTGIGGGIVVGGRLLRGARGIAAEVGHLRLVPDGRICGCGQRGCWEAYASGTALSRTAREAVAGGLPGARPLAGLVDDLDRVDGPTVTAAALAGDPFATALMAETGTWLGEGIAALVTVLDPGVVVVGGGLGEAGDLLLEPARRAFEGAVDGQLGEAPAIVSAAFGNTAGLVGAALLAAADAG